MALIKGDQNMKKWTIIAFVLCLFLGWHGIADAHSTKGRVWVVVKKSRITIDDTAYYIEPYVFEKKYKDKYKKSYNRFCVSEFLNIEQKDGIARVSFIVQDWIAKNKFEDYMLFKKNPDQSWSHIDDKGNVIRSKIRTMKKKSVPVKVWAPVAILAVLFLSIYLYVKRRSRAKQAASWEVDTGQDGFSQ